MLLLCVYHHEHLVLCCFHFFFLINIILITYQKKKKGLPPYVYARKFVLIILIALSLSLSLPFRDRDRDFSKRSGGDMYVVSLSSPLSLSIIKALFSCCKNLNSCGFTLCRLVQQVFAIAQKECVDSFFSQVWSPLLSPIHNLLLQIFNVSCVPNAICISKCMFKSFFFFFLISSLIIFHKPFPLLQPKL